MTSRMEHRTRTFIAVAAIVALVAVPAAVVAAAGGRSAEHANEHAERGRAAAASGGGDAEATDQAPAANETREHPEPHHGFLTALAHVPSWVKAWMDKVLGGAAPNEAHPGRGPQADA